MGQLADWKCHKVVKAGRIMEAPRQDIPTGDWVVGVEDVNGAWIGVSVPAGAFLRGRPQLGDYIILYEDGYKSWSPAKTFENGYTRMSEGSSGVR